MADDTGDRLADLRDDLDRDVQRYESARDRLAPVTAADASGTVHVKLDRDGMIQAVMIDEQWRSQVGAEALPGAVQGAWAQAGLDRASQWGTDVAETVDEPAPSTRPAPTLSSTVLGQLSELVDSSPGTIGTQAAVEALASMLEEMERGVDEAFGQIDQRLAAQIKGRSSSGHVEATVSGAGAVVAITYDERWIDKAHHANVGRETTEAVHAALRKVGDTDPASVLDGTALGRLRRITEDPVALAEYLRLRG